MTKEFPNIRDKQLIKPKNQSDKLTVIFLYLFFRESRIHKRVTGRLTKEFPDMQDIKFTAFIFQSLSPKIVITTHLVLHALLVSLFHAP